MIGTLILALLFSAYILYSIHFTRLDNEDAKEMGCQYVGYWLSMKCYFSVDEESRITLLFGTNIVTDILIKVVGGMYIYFGVTPRFINVKEL